MISDQVWKDERINNWIRQKYAGTMLNEQTYLLFSFITLVGRVCRSHG